MSYFVFYRLVFLGSVTNGQRDPGTHILVRGEKEKKSREMGLRTKQ